MIKVNTVFRYVAVASLAIVFLLKNSLVFCTHNTSRYFPFLERPEEYVIKKRSHISPSLFIAKASTAFKRGGGNTGIPELWGKYDLNDVINSLKAVDGPTFVNPIQQERGPHDVWIDKSIKFKVDGKVKGSGLILNYEQDLHWNGFQVGCFIPIMHVNTNDHFSFLAQDSAPELRNLREGELSQLDRIRRTVQDDLGLSGGDWTKTGFGDLDLHLRFNHEWNYELLMRNIDLNLQFGTTIPTGCDADINYPSSVPFMGDGHWSVYFDLVTEFELKQDWKFGFIFGAAYQFKNTRERRIPVYNEPFLFSALVANDIEVDPGMTFKFSPYLGLDNLSEGFNVRVRYTHLKHNQDKYKDKRKDPTVKSFLTQQEGDQVGDVVLTAEDISKNAAERQGLTRWSEQYISAQISYDSKEAGNNWIISPIIYAVLDYQFQGNGSCKTYQLTLGVELHF